MEIQRAVILVIDEGYLDSFYQCHYMKFSSPPGGLAMSRDRRLNPSHPGQVGILVDRSKLTTPMLRSMPDQPRRGLSLVVE